MVFWSLSNLFCRSKNRPMYQHEFRPKDIHYAYRRHRDLYRPRALQADLSSGRLLIKPMDTDLGIVSMDGSIPPGCDSKSGKLGSTGKWMERIRARQVEEKRQERIKMARNWVLCQPFESVALAEKRQEALVRKTKFFSRGRNQRLPDSQPELHYDVPCYLTLDQHYQSAPVIRKGLPPIVAKEQVTRGSKVHRHRHRGQKSDGDSQETTPRLKLPPLCSEHTIKQRCTLTSVSPRGVGTRVGTEHAPESPMSNLGAGQHSKELRHRPLPPLPPRAAVREHPGLPRVIPLQKQSESAIYALRNLRYI